MDFEDFYHTHESKLKEQVQLILTDPPYYILKQHERDSLTYLQMETICKLAQSMLKPGGSIVIFCSVEQIQKYIDYLRQCRLNVEDIVMNIIHAPESNLIFDF